MTMVSLNDPRLTQQPEYITDAINDYLRDSIEAAWDEVNGLFAEDMRFAYRPYTFIDVPSYAGVNTPTIVTLVSNDSINEPDGQDGAVFGGGNESIVQFEVAIEVVDDIQTTSISDGGVEANLVRLVSRHASAIKQALVRGPTLGDRVIGFAYRETNYSAVTRQEGRLTRSAVVDLTVLSQ